MSQKQKPGELAAERLRNLADYLSDREGLNQGSLSRRLGIDPAYLSKLTASDPMKRRKSVGISLLNDVARTVPIRLSYFSDANVESIEEYLRTRVDGRWSNPYPLAALHGGALDMVHLLVGTDRIADYMKATTAGKPRPELPYETTVAAKALATAVLKSPLVALASEIRDELEALPPGTPAPTKTVDSFVRLATALRILDDIVGTSPHAHGGVEQIENVVRRTR